MRQALAHSFNVADCSEEVQPWRGINANPALCLFTANHSPESGRIFTIWGAVFPSYLKQSDNDVAAEHPNYNEELVKSILELGSEKILRRLINGENVTFTNAFSLDSPSQAARLPSCL